MMSNTSTTPLRERGTPLRRLALAGFQAVCEAFYPENEYGAPSWRDTEMLRRVALHWDALPPESRLTLEGLYAGLELGGAALAPWIGPLSRMSVAKRYRMFERMRRSKVWPLRFVAEAVKSSSTMIYLSHPLALAHIGAAKGCLEPGKKRVFTDLILTSPSKPRLLEDPS